MGEVFIIYGDFMELEQAIELIKKLVKNNGTNDSKHIDIGLVSSEEKPLYEKALKVVKLAIMEGKLRQDEFEARVHLN
jgi:hypothetical protein